MSFNHRPREGDSNFGNGRRMIRSVADLRGRQKQRPAPPESTGAEAFYYVKQMNSRTPMVLVMNDGEVIRGCIEWYDRNCLKVNREGAPNLLIQKQWIRYLYKQEEERQD